MNIRELKDRLLTTPRRRRMALSGSILGGAILLSATIFVTGPNAAPTLNKEKAWPVSVTHAEPRTLQPNFSAFGRLEANRTAHLRSDLIARIDEVVAKEGDWVDAGDLLVKLDDREARLHVLEQEADLQQQRATLSSLQVQYDLEKQNAKHFAAQHEVAQAKLARHNDLIRKRLISKSLHDQVLSQAGQATIEYHKHLLVISNLPNEISAAQAKVAKAQALVQRAKLDLEKTTITAPFAGPVIVVHAAPGDHSSMGEPLLEMADANSFEVRVQLPDAYVDEVRKANTQTIVATAENGALLKLSRVASHVRAGQTGTDAFFVVSQSGNTPPPLGKVFSLRVSLPNQNDVIALPVQSLYENNRIYAVRDGRLVGLSVERVGEWETAEGEYNILVRSEQIDNGDALITTQLPRAVTGLLVDVANELQTEHLQTEQLGQSKPASQSIDQPVNQTVNQRENQI